MSRVSAAGTAMYYDLDGDAGTGALLPEVQPADPPGQAALLSRLPGADLMPIKPENRRRYPKDWREIRRAILARAGDRCEGSPRYPDCRELNGQPHSVTGSNVVLTVAHLDHTPEHCDPANLRAWCQRCHNTYDAQHRRRNAYATRRRGKAAEPVDA